MAKKRNGFRQLKKDAYSVTQFRTLTAVQREFCIAFAAVADSSTPGLALTPFTIGASGLPYDRHTFGRIRRQLVAAGVLVPIGPDAQFWMPLATEIFRWPDDAASQELHLRDLEKLSELHQAMVQKCTTLAKSGPSMVQKCTMMVQKCTMAADAIAVISARIGHSGRLPEDFAPGRLLETFKIPERPNAPVDNSVDKADAAQQNWPTRPCPAAAHPVVAEPEPLAASPVQATEAVGPDPMAAEQAHMRIHPQPSTDSGEVFERNLEALQEAWADDMPPPGVRVAHEKELLDNVLRMRQWSAAEMRQVIEALKSTGWPPASLNLRIVLKRLEQGAPKQSKGADACPSQRMAARTLTPLAAMAATGFAKSPTSSNTPTAPWT